MSQEHLILRKMFWQSLPKESKGLPNIGVRLVNW
jgi:hypothetical protein